MDNPTKIEMGHVPSPYSFFRCDVGGRMQYIVGECSGVSSSSRIGTFEEKQGQKQALNTASYQRKDEWLSLQRSLLNSFIDGFSQVVDNLLRI